MADEHVCNLGPAPQDEVDEVEYDEMGNAHSKKSTFGLTPQDKKYIRETWKVAKKDLGKNGLMVFVVFFRDYPHNLTYFPFRNLSANDDLESEPLVKLHALRVMRELSYCIENMDKQETLLHALRQNALSHRKRCISKNSYDELRLSMLKTFCHQLGEQKFKPEAQMALDKALRIIFQVITDINDEKTCICPTQTSGMSPSNYRADKSTASPRR